MNPLPEAALVAARPRDVLVFAELPAKLREELEGLNATLTDAQSVLGTVALLADRTFDAAILDVELSAAIVQRLKAGVGSIEGVPDEVSARARQRHAAVPFFLTFGSEGRYAIVVDPPEHSYLESGKGLSLADAVTRLDVTKLVMRGAALA